MACKSAIRATLIIVKHVTRHIEPRLREALDTFRSVLLHGPRQSGKTTLAKRVAEERGGTYASLDDEQTLSAALEDPRTFLLEQPHPLVIDEIQLGGDRLVRAVKMAVDDSQAKGRFVLTGSSDFLTVPTISESLAGRVAIRRLWPLSAAELAGTEGGGLLGWFEERIPLGQDSPLTRADYLERACAGGYPEAVVLDPSSRRTWFEGYAETVLNRDVASLADVRRADALRSALQLAAARTSGEINIAEWCRELAIDRATLETYLGWLRMVFLLHELPAWSRNLGTRAVRRPKNHLTDTGLAAALLNVDAEALRPPAAVATGPLLETFAVNEIVRQMSSLGKSLHLHYYRDGAGHEIDILIERSDGAVLAVEIKATASPRLDHLRHVAWLRDRLDSAAPGTFRAGVLLHTAQRGYKLGDRLYSLPLSTLWQSS